MPSIPPQLLQLLLQQNPNAFGGGGFGQAAPAPSPAGPAPMQQPGPSSEIPEALIKQVLSTGGLQDTATRAREDVQNLQRRAGSLLSHLSSTTSQGGWMQALGDAIYNIGNQVALKRGQSAQEAADTALGAANKEAGRSIFGSRFRQPAPVPQGIPLTKPMPSGFPYRNPEDQQQQGVWEQLQGLSF